MSELSYGSEVHGGLGVHGGHGESSAGSLAVVVVGVRLGDLVSMDPFRAVLLRDTHLDTVLIDALYHSSVALEGAASDCDRLAHLQLLLLARTAKSRGNTRLCG